MTRRRVPLHTKILLGLLLGATLGVVANALSAARPQDFRWLEPFVANVTVPLGQVFLRLLFMTVIPLVLSTLAVGVANLGDVKKLGRVGLKTAIYFVATTAAAVVVGILLVTALQPGRGIDRDTQVKMVEAYRGTLSQQTRTFEEHGGFGIQAVLRIIPSNPFSAMVEMDMLAVIFFALLLGMAITRIPPERARSFTGFLEAVADTMIVLVGFAMKLAPVAVPALIFSVTARFGAPLLEKLSLFVLTVFIGYALFLFGVFSLLVRFLARVSPLAFFRKAAPVMITAFSTSSSNATLPTTLKVTKEELGVPADIAGFVLPLGATLNMNGTALFEGVTVLFLSQVFGIPLSVPQQALVVALSVLMAIGTAGVPGASIPMIMMVLQVVGIPAEGIAIILGVDRVLDMGRTVLNVTGDMTAAMFIARTEGGGTPPV